MEDIKENSAGDMVRFHIRMAKRQYEELQQLAQYDGRNVSDVIRQIVADYLKGNKRD